MSFVTVKLFDFCVQIELEKYRDNDPDASGSRKLAEKKRSAVKENVSLSVLQQYFSSSLKDFAIRIGVRDPKY